MKSTINTITYPKIILLRLQMNIRSASFYRFIHNKLESLDYGSISYGLCGFRSSLLLGCLRKGKRGVD